MQLKPLNEMTVGQRFILIIVIVLIILFAMAAFGYFTGGWDRADAQARLVRPACVTDEGSRERLRSMMFEAIDEGFKTQISHLYLTMIKDVQDQPQRAAVGVNNAISAFTIARIAILGWDPPICEEKQK